MSKSSSKTSSLRRYGRSAPARSSDRRGSFENTRPLPRPVSPDAASYGWDVVPHLPITDRRLHYPEQPPARYRQNRPAMRISGTPARVVAPPPQKRHHGRPATSQAPFKPHKPLRISAARLLFAQPSSVAVCVQRGVRKEVLHAKRIAGRKGLNKPKRGPSSSISCRK